MIIRRKYNGDINLRENRLIAIFGDLAIGKSADIKYMRDNRLSFRSRGIMAYYFSHADSWIPLQKDLESKSEKDTRYIISKAIGELIDYGYINRRKKGLGQGKGFSWELVVYEVAIDNPNYDPDLHGVPYYAKETISQEAKDSLLECIALSQLAVKGTKPIIEDNSDDSWLISPLEKNETPKVEKKQPLPSDPLDHVLQFMADKHESLSGKPYSHYAIAVHEAFNSSNEIADKDRVMVLGAFLHAYNKVTQQEMLIPGALEDKKYWSKTAGKHLANYTLNQLESMYVVALQIHLSNGLKLATPDSISKGLVEAYQILTSHAQKSQKIKDKLEHAKQEQSDKTYEEIESDLVEKTLNFASGKSGHRFNTNVMWRGYIFNNETDYHATLAYHQNWKAKIDHEAEIDMRQKLGNDTLILEKPLPMQKPGDLFYFRTSTEDKRLFRAFILTQRSTNPNFDPKSFRLEKSIPLGDNLESCELPEFYQNLESSKPVSAASILEQFEQLEQFIN